MATAETVTAEDWPYEALREEAEALRGRINRFRTSLGRFLVAKQELIDLMVVAAVAQEPLLLVGPPGTAKSDLVLKFKDALGLAEGDYFEYMLTRFTEPSEIIGPIDINQLREGRYIRREQGKLPTARLAFLDEIFKSNSAILNILLTIVNERKFYQDGVPQPVRLRVLFAATNEVPEQGELAALKDRFVLKAESRSVQDDHFEELIDSGVRAEVFKALNQKPWAEGHCTLDDLLKANRYLTLQFARAGPMATATAGRLGRPRGLLPGRGVPRVPAADQDPGPRGSDLRQRPQARQALQAAPHPRVAVLRRRRGPRRPATPRLPG